MSKKIECIYAERHPLPLLFIWEVMRYAADQDAGRVKRHGQDH